MAIPSIRDLKNYKTVAPVKVLDYSIIGDFAITYTAGGSGVASSLYTKFSSPTLKLTANNSASAYVQAIKSSLNTSFSSGDRFNIWIYVETVGALNNLYISFSDTDSAFATRYMVADLQGSYPEKLGWNCFTVTKSDFTAVGGILWTDTMQHCLLKLISSGGGYFFADSVWFGGHAKSRIVFGMDDAFLTAYDDPAIGGFYTYLNSKGLKGYVGVIRSAIGTAGYMTEANMATMSANGFEMVTHGTTNLTSLSVAAATADVISNRDYLTVLGYSEASKFYLYPSGGYSDSVKSILSGLGFVLSRTIYTQLQNTLNGIDEPLAIGGVDIGNKTFAQIKVYIDLADRLGVSLFLFGHKLVTGSPGSALETQYSEFTQMVDYALVKQIQGKARVVSMTEFYNGLAGELATRTLYSP